MRGLIKRFDAFLSRVEKIHPFSTAANSLLRLQIARAPHALRLGELLIPAGAPVLMLHLFNEHLPPIPRQGPSLAWALKMHRVFKESLRAAARHISADPALAGLAAIGMITSLFPPDPRASGARFVSRLGFSLSPYRGPLGRFGEFWENLFSYWLIWAYNPAGLRSRRLMRLRRTEAWMPMPVFLEKFGGE